MARKKIVVKDTAEERREKRIKENKDFSAEEFLGGLSPEESDIITTELDDDSLFDGKKFNFKIGDEEHSLPYLTRNVFIVMEAKGFKLDELGMDGIFWLLKRNCTPDLYEYVSDDLIMSHGILPFTHLYTDWLEASNLT